MRKFLLLSCAALCLYGFYSFSFASQPVYQNHQVLVTTGDSLWSIASRYAAPGEDVREVVYRITKASHLRSKTLQPGQVLLVPLPAAEQILLAAK